MTAGNILILLTLLLCFPIILPVNMVARNSFSCCHETFKICCQWCWVCAVKSVARIWIIVHRKPHGTGNGKGKGAYSSQWNSPQNYGTPLVNRITQCYLPPDRGDCPAFTPSGQNCTRFIDPVKMKGWVGLVGWLYTEMVYPSTDGHPSRY